LVRLLDCLKLTNKIIDFAECASEVLSELCVPILSDSGKVIGIIDAESWKKNYFDAAKILRVLHTTHDLGKIELGMRTVQS
jgi:putative methionine-R-sulfoxide reductase with GAF domain